MKILFVISYYYPYIGGAENVVQHLTEGLANRGHRVRVITTRLPGTQQSERINGVEVERVSVPKLGDRYFFGLLSVPAVARRMRSYDLMHTASNNIAIPAYLATKLAGRPVVFTCYEVLGRRWHLAEHHRLKALFFRGVEHLICTFPYDRHVAISRATYTDLLRAGVAARRTRVIYPGTHKIFYERHNPDGKLREFVAAADNDFVYVYFGRPGATKGVDYLVRAAPAIQAAIPQARLVLVLAQEPRAQYERILRLVEQARAQASIHLIPSAPDRAQLVRYLLDANCVVIPSLTEGFGLTTAEACALGVPVVATRAGAIPEVVSGRHILVEPGSAEALCQGVVRAFRGQFDHDTPPKAFTWQAMVSSYEALYKELIAPCT
ncbi:glycosyltransferase family 4 protein [Candidatus Chloroploca sp. Khr17]|uniref:glycosyltransferase family 4 protein n=1 Tax=Candidatus Chloroploca sp. Khr17 TaxID=2496869 RepID=UPI00101D7D75|nr:glycosyltransferase family 4 protein [Candidatus Chloroploca sp. Khr17]